MIRRTLCPFREQSIIKSGSQPFTRCGQNLNDNKSMFFPVPVIGNRCWSKRQASSVGNHSSGPSTAASAKASVSLRLALPEPIKNRRAFRSAAWIIVGSPARRLVHFYEQARLGG